MRRALLSLPSGGAPFTFGPGVTGPGSVTLAANFLVVNATHSAPVAGVVQSVRFYRADTSAFTVMTGALSAGIFTVRDRADITPVAAGQSTATVNMPVQAGDRIAYWSASSATNLEIASGTQWYLSQSTKPTVGTAYTMSSTETKTPLINMSGVG